MVVAIRADLAQGLLELFSFGRFRAAMPFLNEFVLLFLHIAVSLFDLTHGCQGRSRRPPQDRKVKVYMNKTMRFVKRLMLLMLAALLLAQLAGGCRRGRPDSGEERKVTIVLNQKTVIEGKKEHHKVQSAEAAKQTEESSLKT
ncbi:hypothetical protein MSG28_011612 [Choristoneura fumiferana]|uniref:Uncharacterized protein n=1 Tax=Choristoneura fumiferana TaxID=7141 RepID=A0ACC0JNV7_CHOFU|nr:hypothetical protein MSG28_011612 [Choristoneura fumiferana]